MLMELHRDNRTLIIKAKKRIDSSSAEEFFQEMESAIEPVDRAVVIDMDQVDYISSAGLRALLQIGRKVESQNSRLAVCALSGSVLEVFEISGISRVIDVHSSRTQAIEAVGG